MFDIEWIFKSKALTVFQNIFDTQGRGEKECHMNFLAFQIIVFNALTVSKRSCLTSLFISRLYLIHFTIKDNKSQKQQLRKIKFNTTEMVGRKKSVTYYLNGP